MDLESKLKILFDFEQDKYPYFDVVEIDIISINGDIVTYQPKIMSRMDTKWSKWDRRKEVKFSELVQYSRDVKIDSIIN